MRRRICLFMIIAATLTFGSLLARAYLERTGFFDEEVIEIETTTEIIETEPETEAFTEPPEPQPIFDVDLTDVHLIHITCGDKYEVMDTIKSFYSCGTLVNEERYINEPYGLNFRSFPSTEYDNVKYSLSYGDTVHVIASFEEGWSVAEIQDHVVFCRSEYLSEEPPADLVYIDGEIAEYLGTFKLTAYCECEKCCGKWANDNKTASGTAPTEGRTIASNELPFGTKVSIYGHTYTVEDRGVEGMHIDIYFESHQDALVFGKRYAEVYALPDTVAAFYSNVD